MNTYETLKKHNCQNYFMAKNTKSSLSFEGYSVVEWLRGSKDAFKILTAAIVTFLAYFANLAPEPYNALLAALVAFLSTLLLDGIDYWLTKK